MSVQVKIRWHAWGEDRVIETGLQVLPRIGERVKLYIPDSDGVRVVWEPVTLIDHDTATSEIVIYAGEIYGGLR